MNACFLVNNECVRKEGGNRSARINLVVELIQFVCGEELGTAKKYW